MNNENLPPAFQNWLGQDIIVMALIIRRTLQSVSRWCLRLWGLMWTVLQLEAVRSFSIHYAKREAVPVRNCLLEKIRLMLTVNSNMSKLKSVISPCLTRSAGVWIQAILFTILWKWTNLCSFLQASRVGHPRLCNISETLSVYFTSYICEAAGSSDQGA